MKIDKQLKSNLTQPVMNSWSMTTSRDKVI